MQYTSLVSVARRKSEIYRQAAIATAVGLAANLSLGVVKAAAGIVASSFALISDAINSLGDALTSLVVLIALRLSQREPDAEHPYGHTKAEAIAATAVALLIVVSALLVGWEAIHRVSRIHPIPPVWTLWLAGANVAIKEGLYRYKVGAAKRTGSSALIAVAWDHRSDALCSLAVLVGLGVVRVGGSALMFADEVAALVVVAIILVGATGLLRRCISELMDAQAERSLVDAVRNAAEGVEHVLAIEKLLVRKSGLEFLVDVHVQVDRELPVWWAHAIGHRVKDTLLHQFAQLRDVLVHIEPFEPGAEELSDTRVPSPPTGLRND